MQHASPCQPPTPNASLTNLPAAVPACTPGTSYTGGRLSGERCALLALDLLRGLAELHALGVVMGDLKPENVLLDNTGQPLLCDCGLSRAITTTVGQHGATTSPQGTYAYM